MGYCRATALPAREPVTLAQAKSFMRLPVSYVAEDATITGFIAAAREQGEIISGYGLAQRTWVQVLDTFPYRADAGVHAYPSSFYSLSLWGYAQKIKLSYPPVKSVQAMRYVGADGQARTLSQDTDFLLDRITVPPRIFPPAGQTWPAALYVANSVEIDYTAGYDPDPNAIDTHNITADPPYQQPSSTIVTGVPQMVILGILNLVAFWFQNRGAAGIVPAAIERVFQQHMVVDFA